MDHFLGLLQSRDVEMLVDVRSSPYSRYSPQFNRETLAAVLDDHSIRYEYLGGLLGGRPDDLACYDDDGHVLYDELEQTAAFREGLAEIELQLRQKRTMCLMCSEENPATCHRALSIGFVALGLGIEMHHLRKDGTVQSQSELHVELFEQPRQASLFEETPPRKSLQPVLRERAPNNSSRS